MDGSTFNQIRIFQIIAQEGSISAAARKLEMAVPSVSASLKHLEQTLGLPLFTRSTRKIELTEAGELLVNHTKHSMAELNLAVESVSDLSKTPRGKVRITMPRFVFQQIVSPIYADFCTCYPDIELEISLYDGTVDIIKEGFDLGIRFGDRIGDGMVARQIMSPREDALFASTKYIDKYGLPTSIEALKDHRLIYYRFITSNQLLPLTLQNEGNTITVDIKPSLVVNDTDLMKDAALKGLGIGRLLLPIVKDDIDSGKLVPILQEHWISMPGVYIYFNQHAQKAKRVRAFIDFVMDNLPN
ncbi:MAG: LysR family transcriptional regulator [Colwelliaceae bacterium]|nr:LysR family transcriptional regulator [Colwelliaceae bacterium]